MDRWSLWSVAYEHGQGTFTSADGSKYVGEWEDGRMYSGTMTYPDGTKQNGEWKDGEFIK